MSAIIIPASSVATVTPPNGRANYVVALMRNVGTESYVVLAEYSLRADGSARADYWSWKAKTLQPRSRSGFSTAGCAHSCTVWTANGFQSLPSQLYGTWLASDNNLSVRWATNGQTERWRFRDMSTVTKLDLASHPTATNGFGWGSRIGFATGVSASAIYHAHGTYSGPYVGNNYGVLSSGTSTQVIHQPDENYPNRLCSDNCINISTVTNKVYLAGTGNGRKIFYNHQLFADNPHPCIGGTFGPGAGHLKPALQIVDDTGAFRGLVVVEAALYAFKYGGNIMGIFDMNDVESVLMP